MKEGEARFRELFEQEYGEQCPDDMLKGMVTIESAYRLFLAAWRLRGKRDADAMLTAEQLRALADFVLRHGDLDKNSTGLTALILRNKAEVAAAIRDQDREQ